MSIAKEWVPKMCGNALPVRVFKPHPLFSGCWFQCTSASQVDIQGCVGAVLVALALAVPAM